MSILNSIERIAALDRSKVTLDPARCLHSIDQFSTCAACADLCPVQAINPGKPPRLNAESCTSCLACLPACPTGAYSADDEVVHLLNCIPHLEGEAVELLCSQHPHPHSGSDPEHTAIRVKGCLAGLGSAAYIGLYTLGLRQITLRSDACAECPWSSLASRVRQGAADAQAFLAGWEENDVVDCQGRVDQLLERTLWEASNPPLSRRDLFRMIGRQGKTTLARALDQKPEQKGVALGRDRQRILASVKHLPTPQRPEQVAVDRFGFAILAVSATCSACGACARACPTDALDFSINEAGEHFSLALDPALCTGCKVCSHVCAPAAIEVEHSPSFSQVFVRDPILLQDGELSKCQRCGARFARREDTLLCPNCDFRQKNPFRSFTPLGLKYSRPDQNQTKKV